ncbi:hypothetical protein Tco_1534100, partial [Tanacetum coccineum]
YGMASDDYEGPPVFDDDQYEDVIEEEEGFVDKYPSFQKDETNVSFSSIVLGVEEESMPVYDTDIEDAIEDEEGFIGKRGFGEEEDNMEDVVVMANDLCSSKIQTITMLLMVEQNCGEHLIRRFAGRGNGPDPSDVKIASLKQWIQELEFPQLQQDSPAEEAKTESNVWDDRSEDVNPFSGGNLVFHDDHYDNPLLTKETESEPII